ncbi:MAG: GIY-YIG nuclease family protein [Actinomycetota bacterium]
MVNARLTACADQDVLVAVESLQVRPHIMPASSWPGEEVGIQEAGLYSWWVDEAGAADLAEGLELPVAAGRIYAGQAGATRWPSGTRSSATLVGRIRSQHLGGNIYGSTFRLTLASSLAKSLALTGTGDKRLAAGGEKRLSAWIQEHLSVAVHPYPNRDASENLEHRVLEQLDPPLNLRGMDPSPLRERLKGARKSLLGVVPTSHQHQGDHDAEPPAARQDDSDKVTLHAEIADILREHGNPWMTTQEIADGVNERDRYRKRDGSAVTAFQIHGRTRNYGHIFDRQGSQVRLLEAAL